MIIQLSYLPSLRSASPAGLFSTDSSWFCWWWLVGWVLLFVCSVLPGRQHYWIPLWPYPQIRELQALDVYFSMACMWEGMVQPHNKREVKVARSFSLIVASKTKALRAYISQNCWQAYSILCIQHTAPTDFPSRCACSALPQALPA